MLKHVVMIKYKPDAPEAHIQRFVQQARDMFVKSQSCLRSRSVAMSSRSRAVGMLCS